MGLGEMGDVSYVDKKLKSAWGLGMKERLGGEQLHCCGRRALAVRALRGRGVSRGVLRGRSRALRGKGGLEFCFSSCSFL